MAETSPKGKPSVYDHIVEMLVTQQIKGGDRIPETMIAEKLGVSRTPIREAMRRLANEGVITIYPNRYAEVVTIDDEYISQLGQARIAIDTMVAKLAVYYGSNADFEKLRQLAEEASESAKTGDMLRRNETDIAFHQALITLSGNKIIERMYNTLKVQIARLLYWKYIQEDTAYAMSLSHLQLVDALFDRDEKRAVAIAASHMAQFYMLGKHFPPEFFGTAGV